MASLWERGVDRRRPVSGREGETGTDGVRMTSSGGLSRKIVLVRKSLARGASCHPLLSPSTSRTTTFLGNMNTRHPWDGPEHLASNKALSDWRSPMSEVPLYFYGSDIRFLGRCVFSTARQPSTITLPSRYRISSLFKRRTLPGLYIRQMPRAQWGSSGAGGSF